MNSRVKRALIVLDDVRQKRHKDETDSSNAGARTQRHETTAMTDMRESKVIACDSRYTLKQIYIPDVLRKRRHQWVLLEGKRVNRKCDDGDVKKCDDRLRIEFRKYVRCSTQYSCLTAFKRAY